MAAIPREEVTRVRPFEQVVALTTARKQAATCCGAEDRVIAIVEKGAHFVRAGIGNEIVAYFSKCRGLARGDRKHITPRPEADFGGTFGCDFDRVVAV